MIGVLSQHYVFKARSHISRKWPITLLPLARRSEFQMIPCSMLTSQTAPRAKRCSDDDEAIYVAPIDSDSLQRSTARVAAVSRLKTKFSLHDHDTSFSLSIYGYQA